MAFLITCLIYLMYVLYYIMRRRRPQHNEAEALLTHYNDLISKDKNMIIAIACQSHLCRDSRVTFQILLHHKYARNIKIRNFIRFEDEI